MAGLGTLTLDLVAKTGNFSQDMKRAGDTVDRESRRIETSIGSAMKSIAGLGAAAVAGITVGSVIGVGDAYVQMAAQIRNATTSQQEYEQVQKHLLETANTTYRSLQEAQQVYLDVGGALKAYGETTERALRITDSLSFSYTHNATAADKAATATNAFMKSLYEGKVSGDSWRSMLSAIPSIVDDLSKSLNVSKAEILTLGNAGKITIDQLKTSFDQSRESSENLANAMENSLNDGLTTLSNAWSVMVGELNLTYGITNKMAAGLGLLAENLDTVTVAGSAVAIMYAAKLTPSIAWSAVSFTGATIEAARYQVALARMSVQAASTSSSLTILSGVTRGVFAFMTGPAGLVITAAGVAAGYMAMRDSTEKATKKLIEQAAVADKTREELLKLQGVQKQSAIDDLTDAFEEQNKALRKSELAMGSRLIAIQNAMKGDVEATDISNKARLGVISYKDAIEQLNKLPISPELFKALEKEYQQYEKNRVAAQKTADAQANLGIKVKLLGNEVENTARKNDLLNASLNNGEKAANGAASAYDEYINKLRQKADEEKWVASYAERTGLSTNEARVFWDAKQANDGKVITQQQANELHALYLQSQATKQVDEARSKALETQRAQTKELEKQNKLTKNLGNGLVSNSHLKGLPIKSRESISGGSVRGYTAEFAQILGKELKGSINAFTSFNDKYHQGKGGRHPQGQAFDLRLNSGTNSARVDAQVKALADKYGYVVKTLDEYKNPSKNSTGGHLHVSVTGRKDGQKGAKAEIDIFDEIDNRAEQSAQNQLQLRLAVADEVTRIRMNLAEDIKEIDKAGYSDTEATSLKAKYRERAENDVAIAQLALKTKVDSYSDYLKTEEQLLRESYAARQVETLNDFDMSKEDRKKASDHLLQQLQIEADAIKRAEDFQVNNAFEAYLNQSEIVVKRYALERDEIAKTYRLTEATRQKLLEANKMGTFQELNNASSVISQMGLEAAQATMQRINPQQFAQYQLQNQYSQSSSDLTDAYNNQVSGINQLEDEQQRNAELLAAHEQYLQARAALDEQHAQQEKDLKDAQLDMQLASAESGFGSMTEMLRKSGEERSGIYRAMLVMEKSAAIARSIMAIQTGIAEASANPFPYNIAAMASVAAATTSIVSNIQAVSAGFYDGGYTGDGGKYVAAGIVHKGEVVWSQDDIARWGGVANVEAMRLGRSLGGYSDGGIVGSSSTRSFPNIDFTAQQPQIVINTPPGMSARTEQRDGKTYVTIEDVQDYLRDQVNRSNSDFNKDMRQNFNIQPKRP
ncbi:tape measure protein [Acinetobacter rudis]|uniref:tape measure protein n=1 Tax=Acinetobacter rudis TaxID=632955 RepID=UPI0033410986